jgi:hypothetical protein
VPATPVVEDLDVLVDGADASSRVGQARRVDELSLKRAEEALDDGLMLLCSVKLPFGQVRRR